jgi:sn-glycerol 3-phosphate transport system substrate-binding protein
MLEKYLSSRMVSAAALLLAVLLFLACGEDSSSNGTSEGVVKVSFWHSMRSPVSNSLQRIVDEFNASQTAYRVETIYQGSYTESLNKLIAASPTKNVPALIQLDDVSTQLMQDSGAIVSVQDFVDEEAYDLSDFEPKALQYYRNADGRLDSMPFNLAGPILFYDKEDFRAAGLDPEEPPQTLDEVRAAAERLQTRDDSGKVVRNGIALQVSAWFFEQMLAKQGVLYANNSNGRDKRATEAIFNSAEGTDILTWYRDMVEDGLAYYANDDTDALLSVAQDRTAMSIGSTAVVNAAVALVAVAGQDPARLGTGPIPAPPPAGGKEGGIVLGGASFWIMDRRPEGEQRGAWEFVKFASTPEQQAQWHADTGYFPTRLSAYELPVAVEKRETFPQFTTAIEQLRASPDVAATQGALVGPFQAVRGRVTRAFQQVLAGADPAEELDSAVDDATDAIKEYNRTAG